MKKFLSLSLALSTVFLVACSGGDSSFSKDKNITIVSREDGSGTRGAFIELFDILKKDENGNQQDTTSPDAIIGNKTDVIASNVASDPYAIGYMSLGSVSDTVKPVSIDGVMPTTSNVKDGSYTVSRDFNIVFGDEIHPIAEDFKNFILSEQGQEVVASSYVKIDENAKAFTSKMPSGTITIAGSTSVAPIMEKLSEKYKTINPDVIIEIQSTGTSPGILSVIDGTAHMGMASRPLKESEPLTEIPILIDALAIVVNPENPIETLSYENVHDIFVGDKNIWSDFIK